MNSGRHECTRHARRLPAALLTLAVCALAPPFASAKLSTPSTERSGSTPATTFQPFNLSTSSYVWGLDLDGTLQGVGGVGGLLAVIRADGVYLPCYDANGNITEYVSTNGDVVAHYDYSPFGEQLISSGPLASTFTHRFSNKPWCADTGLVEYQLRKYRPGIGRWMSRDPLFDVKQLTATDRISSGVFKNGLYRINPSQVAIEPYLFNSNGLKVDILGLFTPDQILDCQERCNEIAKSLPGNVTFLRHCLANCFNNPCYVPSVPDLLTPHATKPSWDFERLKNNWLTIIVFFKSIWEEIWDR